MCLAVIRAAAALALAALLAACAEEPADNSRCVMQQVADMKVLNARGVPIVEVGVDGHRAAFIVDTGASFSTITPEAVDRFGVSVDVSREARVNGVGGMALAYPATVDDMDLGTAAARRVTLLEVGSFGHTTVDGLPLSGLFGGDFLANYDVELDLPARRVSLYREQFCRADFPQPWAGTAYRDAFELDGTSAILLDAKLDGHQLQMQLDSGAAGTIVGLGAAADAGVPAAMRQGDRTIKTHGIDEARLTTWIHRFASLEIGPDRLPDPVIAIADIQSNNLLGADFLRTHRVWISYAHGLIWVQPVGPVHFVHVAPAPAPH